MVIKSERAGLRQDLPHQTVDGLIALYFRMTQYPNIVAEFRQFFRCDVKSNVHNFATIDASYIHVTRNVAALLIHMICGRCFDGHMAKNAGS